MSKAVLISIHPKWCRKITNAEKIKIFPRDKTIEVKTIEVRKTRPMKIRPPFPCLIYCTIDYENMYYDVKRKCVLNGKVIGEFICDVIVEYPYPFSYDKTDCADTLIQLGCLSIDEVWEYGKGKTLYGWHISDLKIYDEPKELSEFRTICKYGDDYPCHICNKAKRDNHNILYCDNTLKRPPQSWCYVEAEND